MRVVMLAFYAAVLANLPLSLFLLVLYRRAVARAMQTRAMPPAAETETGAIPEEAALSPPTLSGDRTDLIIDTIDTDRALRGTPAAGPDAIGEATGKATGVSMTAAAVFSLVIEAGWLLTLGGHFYVSWSLWWLVLNGWPVPLAAGLVIGATRDQWVKITASYAIIFIGLSLFCLALYQNMRMSDIVFNSLSSVLVALPVIALFYRPVRAIGMLVFAFTLTIFVLLVPLVVELLHLFLRILEAALVDDPTSFPVVGALALIVGPEVIVVGGVIFLIVIGCVTAGLLGWLVLKGIGRAYRRKRLNDHSLMQSSLWGIVALSQATLLSTQEGGAGEDWSWVVCPAVAFAGYWLTERIGLALLRRRVQPRAAAPTLLFLRVFSLGRRSRRLFDVLAPRWLRAGGLVFITGPDLATGTVQPDLFLEYLAGRLRRQFVKSDEDLRNRLAELDLRPDFDGRYRANQLLCSADTWQGAVQQLARRADAALMDVRNFSASNQGCLFELRLLFEQFAIERIVLITDRTTDQPFLDTTLRRLWTETSASNSPKAAATSSRLRVLQLGRLTAREARSIVRMLFDVPPARPESGTERDGMQP